MDKFKALVIAVWGALMSALGILAIPVLLLVNCNVIDYFTAIPAAKERGQVVNSKQGIKGITKKICMWLLVVIGVIIDTLLTYASNTIGLVLPFKFLVACVVAIWLVCNEIISILENISDIGVTLPPFLQPIIKNLKSQVESKAGVSTSGTVEMEEKKNE